MNAPTQWSARARQLRVALADFCHVLLATVTLLASCLFCALGIVLALILLAGGGDGVILFSHLENLSRRYLAASSQARAAFDRDAAGLLAGLTTLLLLARLPLWVDRLRAELRKDADHD